MRPKRLKEIRFPCYLNRPDLEQQKSLLFSNRPMLRCDIFPKYGNRHQIGGCVCLPSASPASTQTSVSCENISRFSRRRASDVCVSFSGGGLRKRPLSHSEMTRVRIQSVMGRTRNATGNATSQKPSPPSVRCHRPWQRQAPAQRPTMTARATSRACYTCTSLFRICFISFFDSVNPLPSKRMATGVSYVPHKQTYEAVIESQATASTRIGAVALIG